MRAFVLVVLLAACGGRIADSDGGSSNDASTQADGGTCIDLEPSAFGTSCDVDTDCLAVYSGNLCSGYNCICPNSSISAQGQPAYAAAMSKVAKGSGPMCSCPPFGMPHCIASECVFCPNPALNPPSLPPGCPDGG